MNAKQARKAKRKFRRTQGHKLVELKLLGASPSLMEYHANYRRSPPYTIQSEIDILRGNAL